MGEAMRAHGIPNTGVVSVLSAAARVSSMLSEARRHQEKNCLRVRCEPRNKHVPQPIAKVEAQVSSVGDTTEVLADSVPRPL